MSALIVRHVLQEQGERLRPMNGFRVEATDDFGFKNLLRPSQGRRRNGLDPNRLVIQINAEKRRLAMLHCVSQR